MHKASEFGQNVQQDHIVQDRKRISVEELKGLVDSDPSDGLNE